ncbi:hypothetical protein Tco_1088710 [Tanacetum coccineum]
MTITLLNITANNNLPPRTVSLDSVAIVASRVVDPVGSPSSTTIDQDKQSTRPVPQLMALDHSSLGPVLHEMMSDHNSSDLVPQLQEMSVENVSWIEAMQDELHQFEQTKHLGTCRQNICKKIARFGSISGFLLPKAADKSFPIYQMDVKTANILNESTEGRGLRCSAEGFRLSRSSKQV